MAQCSSNSKKQKTKDKFRSFVCTCSASTDKYVPLKLTPDRLSCILSNYKIYMTVRRMWNVPSKQYKNAVERNITYPTETVENVKLVSTDSTDFAALYKNATLFKLYVLSHVNLRDFYKHVEYHCCTEFVEFINKHVYNGDLTKEINEAEKVMDNLKMCNFYNLLFKKIQSVIGIWECCPST